MSEMAETWTWKARIRITVRKHRKSYTMNEFAKLIAFGYLDEEEIIESTAFNNVVTNGGRNLLRNILSGAETDGEIKALGWGLSATAPAVTQTALISESGRKQTTSQRNTATPGQLITTVYIAPAEGNVNIRELGWFAGFTVSITTINTGILISRVLYTRNKTNLESIQVDRIDTIA